MQTTSVAIMSLLRRTAAPSPSWERPEHLAFSPLALSQPNMHRANFNRSWWRSAEDEVSVRQLVSVLTRHFATGDVRRWDGFVHKSLGPGKPGTSLASLSRADPRDGRRDNAAEGGGERIKATGRVVSFCWEQEP